MFGTPKPSDDEILAVLKRSGSSVTYVVANWLHSGAPKVTNAYPGIKTAYVRRRLERLQREGKVVRAPTAYAVMHCWGLVPEPGGPSP